MLILQFFLSFHVAAKKALIFGGSGEFTSSLDIIHQNGTIELSDRGALRSFGGGTARSYQWYDLLEIRFNAFYRHCSVLYRDEPYLIGGFPTAYYQQVIKYNGVFWIQAQRLPEPIYGQVCGVHDDRIWVCAGKHILGHSNRKCFLFDGENWSSVNANEARLAPQKELLNPIESFWSARKIAETSWRCFARWILHDRWRSRVRNELSRLNNINLIFRILYKKLTDQKSPLRTVEKCTQTGCIQTSLYPKPVNMASAVSVNGTIFVFGGYDGQDLLREIYSFGSFSAGLPMFKNHSN